MRILKPLRRFLVMMGGIQMMSVRNVGMMCSLFVLPFGVMFCGQLVMLGGVLMVFGRFVMVVTRIVMCHWYLR